jgi:hypothetical protein
MSLPQRMASLALAILALGALDARAAEVDRLVPAGATAIASIDVRQLAESPLLKQHAPGLVGAALDQNPALKGLLDAAGVDPLRDVSTLVLAATGTKPEQGLLIVHGKFDVARAGKAAEAFAREHPDRLTIHAEGATVVYENRSPQRPYFAAFADSGTAVAALSRDMLAAALKAGKQPPTLRPELQALAGKADGTKCAWLVALVPPELTKQLKGNDNTADVADRIRAFSATLDVDRDVEVIGKLHTTDAKAAGSIAEMLDGLRGFARLTAQNNSVAGDLLAQAADGLKIRARGSAVELRARVPGAAIDRTLKKAPKR